MLGEWGMEKKMTGKPNCSVCGASRIILDRVDGPGEEYGACGHIGCPRPLFDYDREHLKAGAAVSASQRPTDEQYLKLAQGLTNLYICNDRLTPALQDKRTADFLKREMEPFFAPAPAPQLENSSRSRIICNWRQDGNPPFNCKLDANHSGDHSPRPSGPSVPKVEPHYWLIFYEDAGLQPQFETFTDEQAARERHKALSLNWNCHLFEQRPTQATDTASAPQKGDK